MTEEQYIARIEERSDSEEATSPESMSLVDKAVEEYPNSAALWCLRGDLIQLGGEEITHELSEALESYRKAISVCPDCAEVYESIGFYNDVIEEDLEAAEQAFKKALQLEQREDSYVGLARVLAERGEDKNEIVRFLDECPFAYREKISDIRSEIEEGVW